MGFFLPAKFTNKTFSGQLTAKMARPAHKPTVATRRKVAVAAGGGMTHEDIALAIGISRPTLDKHYAAELSAGAAARRVEVLESLFRAATKKGSSSAAKAYLAHAPEVAAPPVEPEKPKGKKAQANEDAKTAQQGTGWDNLLPDNVTPLRKAG